MSFAAAPGTFNKTIARLKIEHEEELKAAVDAKTINLKKSHCALHFFETGRFTSHVLHVQGTRSQCIEYQTFAIDARMRKKEWNDICTLNVADLSYTHRATSQANEIFILCMCISLSDGPSINLTACLLCSSHTRCRLRTTRWIFHALQTARSLACIYCTTRYAHTRCSEKRHLMDINNWGTACTCWRRLITVVSQSTDSTLTDESIAQEVVRVRHPLSAWLIYSF